MSRPWPHASAEAHPSWGSKRTSNCSESSQILWYLLYFSFESVVSILPDQYRLEPTRRMSQDRKAPWSNADILQEMHSHESYDILKIIKPRQRISACPNGLSLDMQVAASQLSWIRQAKRTTANPRVCRLLIWNYQIVYSHEISTTTSPSLAVFRGNESAAAVIYVEVPIGENSATGNSSINIRGLLHTPSQTYYFS